jgi:hypothetical protein
VGRPKIEGNEICPKCGKLGRLGQFSSRNGEYKNARTREYLRFKHNDKIINDCYGIEKALREKELEKIRNGPNSVFNEGLFSLTEDIKDVANKFKIIAENIRETNIDPKDDKRYALMLEEGSKYYIEASFAVIKYIKLLIKKNKTPAEQQALNKFNEIIDNIEKQREEIIKLYYENPKKCLRLLKRTLKKDKMLWMLHLWFEKYERLKREKAREKLAKEKLSESAFGSSKYKADYIVNRTH